MNIIQQKTLSFISNKTRDSAYVGCSAALHVANIRASRRMIEATFIRPSFNRKIECSSGKTRYSYIEKELKVSSISLTFERETLSP